MTIHLGNVPAGSTLYIPFATYNAAGASVTLTGLAVTDIEIYKNGSVTQRASDAGYTLLDTDGIDFDAITGIHGFSVDLADDTTAGFYAAGSFYWVIVSAVTIDAQTVNFIAATFRIDTEIAAILADTGELQTDWVNGGRLDLLIDAIKGKTDGLPSDPADASVIAGRFDTLDTSVADLPTNAELATSQAAADDATLAAIAALTIPTVGAVADAVWDEAIADHAGVGSTGAALAAAGGSGDPWSTALPGAYGAGTAGKIVGDNINATVSSRASQTSVDTVDDILDTEVAAILADTNELQTDWVNGGRLDLLIDAVKGKTDALPSDPADASVIAGRFDTLDTSVADLPTVAELATSQAAADDDTLVAIAALSIPTAEAISDVVWDELVADHADVGSTGAALAAAGGSGDPWSTALPGAYGVGTAGQLLGGGMADDAVLAQVALVRAKTDSLSFTVAGVVDANLQRVNDVEIAGTGVEGSDEWRPI